MKIQIRDKGLPAFQQRPAAAEAVHPPSIKRPARGAQGEHATDQVLEAALEAGREVQPLPLVDAEPFQDRRQLGIDAPALVLAQLPPRPVHQRQVVGQPEGQPARHGLAGVAGKGEQVLGLLVGVIGLDRALRPLDAPLHRGVLGALRRLGHARTDRVEIDIGERTCQRLLIEQRLALEPPLPEPPRAAVLAVGLAGDGLVEAAHVPADVHQSCPPLGDRRLQHLLLLGVQRIARQKPTGVERAGKEPVPAFDHLAPAPGCSLRTVDVQHHMVVVVHHRVGTDVDGEDLGQRQEPCFDPFAPVRVGAARSGILAAEKGAAHAA